MALPDSQTHPDHEIEQLLSGLAGVLSARIVTGASGRIEEAHVLASNRMHPKQIVRNVESALSAGFGIVVDRRIISVAQTTSPDIIRELRVELRSDAGAGAGQRAPAADFRFMFVGCDVRHTSAGETMCDVTLRAGNEHYTGSGTAGSSMNGRASAAARALFNALATATDRTDFALDDVSVVDANGRTHVLITARALRDRHAASLSGCAVIGQSVEDAAVLASLQALNRWVGA